MEATLSVGLGSQPAMNIQNSYAHHSRQTMRVEGTASR